MKILVLIVFSLVIAITNAAVIASPLHYQSFVIVTLDASVTAICEVDITDGLSGQYRELRSPQPAPAKTKLQKIRIKVLRVLHTELKRLSAPPINPGDTIEVINQYLDQPPPFAVGDIIRARLRLVLPEDKYDPADPRQQWWFFPLGDEDSISPPRQPYKNITVID